MFRDALWESQTHGSNKLIVALTVFPLLFLLATPFAIHFYGFGAVVIILLSLFLVTMAALCVIGRKNRWNDGKLIFAFTEEGIMFTSIKNPSSYFSDEYSNIAGYDYIEDGEYTTVSIFFKTPSNAGIYGNLKSLKMVKISDFDQLLKVLQAHEVERVHLEKKA